MTPQTRKFASEDARQLLENKLFKMAFEHMANSLEAQALTCNPDDKDKAQRVVIAKQILVGIRREIERIVEDGVMADFQLAEVEQKKTMLQRVMRR
jgi:hypothetical protein